ncbi:MAG TPA: CHRD domain-containing protein [Streptosporangiaceae bacterium]
MNVVARARKCGVPDSIRRFTRLGAAAITALVLAVLVPVSAGPVASAATTRTTVTAAPVMHHLKLHAMPHGSVAFGRDRHHHLIVRISVYGLTPGSSHAVDLRIPNRLAVIRFSPLTAASSGRALATLASHFAGRWPRASQLVIRLGAGRSRLDRTPIAVTRRLPHSGRHHRLIAVEVSRHGVSFGTPHGAARLSYNSRKHTLTVLVHASGLTPGPHAAHIHLGSCQNQGPVKYMLNDLIANRHGIVRQAVSVFTNVTQPIPAQGWYLNIHQGNSRNILHNGQPTIFFRPLLCANIR